MLIVANIIRYLLVLAIVILLAGRFAQQSWHLYQFFFSEPGGSWLDLSDFAGLMLNYIFFMPLFFVILGQRHKYWLIGVFMIPILFFEFSSDWRFIKVDILIAAAGLITGIAIRSIAAHTLGKIPALEPMKKYF